MLAFQTIIQRYGQQGEKTGWTYITIPADAAQQLKPDTKRSYRVKGKLDGHAITGVALVPVGGGDFILAPNGAMRKAIGKGQGDALQVQLEADEEPPKIVESLLACLEDEPLAKAYFFGLPPSHQLYYSRWIESAKGEATRIRRIAQAINGMAQGKDFGQMIREGKGQKSGF